MNAIVVNKPYLPDKEKYKAYIDELFESGWLTNNGKLVQELEDRLQAYLKVRNVVLTANGSLALQLAYHALGLTGEVITTPFSFAATTNTMVWEGLKPVFADIDPQTFNLNPDNIEAKITSKTSAIVPVHVYGNPCDVESIQTIADQYGLKVVYDAAHAFGVDYKGESVLNHGDISALSFHATKLFHTIEGGAVVTNDDKLAQKVRYLTNFGITVSGIKYPGINAKMNEFEAAMGLCVLDDIEQITQGRQQVWQAYKNELKGLVDFQTFNADANNNHAYAPVLFRSEQDLLKVESQLKASDIITKRYFYPSLDTLGYLSKDVKMSIARDIAGRILCLPISTELSQHSQTHIISLIKECLS